MLFKIIFSFLAIVFYTNVSIAIGNYLWKIGHLKNPKKIHRLIFVYLISYDPYKTYGEYERNKPAVISWDKNFYLTILFFFWAPLILVICPVCWIIIYLVWVIALIAIFTINTLSIPVRKITKNDPITYPPMPPLKVGR